MNDLLQRPYRLFGWAFCATSVTICSGAMAERAHMTAYVCYALVMSAIMYPVLADSAWTTTGLLSSEFHGDWVPGHSYHDFAGSGVVHFVGGTAAAVGNAFLGRRILRPSPFPDSPGVSFDNCQAVEDAVAPPEGWTRRFS